MYLGDLWACSCHSWDQDYKKDPKFSNAGINHMLTRGAKGPEALD